MINQEIKNENYFRAIELLLSEFSSSENPDHLERVYNILSNSTVASRFTEDFINAKNDLFAKHKFAIIRNKNKMNEVGVAEFPVVGEDNSYDSIRGIIVSKGRENNFLDDKIVNKKEILVILNKVQREIQQNIRDNINEKVQDITILNWGYTFKIREHLLIKTKEYPIEQKFCIEGNSLHFAVVVAFISKIFELPINPNFIFTGSFNEDGESSGIDKIILKTDLIMKERPKTESIFIPSLKTFDEDEKKFIKSNKIFVAISNYSELISKVFTNSIRELTKMDLEKRKTLGHARIWVEYKGKRKLEFHKGYETKTEERICAVLNFMRPDDDSKAYKVFPIEKIYDSLESLELPNFLIINGGMANTYMGNIVSSNQYRPFNGIMGIRDGTGTDVIVFAARDGSGLAGYKCKYF